MLIFSRITVLIFTVMFLSLPHSGWSAEHSAVPQYEMVMAIMEPIEYSGIHNIIDKDAQLKVDFEKGTWTLFNYVLMNDDDSDILIDGKKGLCMRLSRYVYHQIKPIFPEDRYQIYFEKTKEKSFFFAPQATHIILSVYDKQTSQKYLIDPSFKKYGRAEDLDQYILLDHYVPEEFMRSNSLSTKYYKINSALPIFLRDGHLIIFSVESADGETNQNHFILSISAVKSQAQSGEYLLGLRYVNGYIQTYSNEDLMRQLLKPDEITKLQQRLLQWSMLVSRNHES